MADTAHTPAPWNVMGTHVFAADGALVCSALSLDHADIVEEANAAHIVKCVNEAEDLHKRIAELEAGRIEMLDAFENAQGAIEYEIQKITHPNGRKAHHLDSTEELRIDGLTEALNIVTNALTKAGSV